MKELAFSGRALDDLRAFPPLIRRVCGYQLDKVQQGREPDDWKPMPSVGNGVREIRVRGDDGAFRVVYIATLKDAVYVLHCFVKKSDKTPKSDIDLAKDRYRELMRRMQ